MEFAIRRLTVDDWRSLRTVRLSALRDSPEAYNQRYDDEVELDGSFWRGLFSSTNALFQAESGADPVGLAVGIAARQDDVDPEAAHLGSMWVAPAARGTGVADALVDAVVRWARDTGHPRLALWVYDVTPRAESFYRRASFTDTGVTRTSDDDPRTMRLMTRTL